MFVCVYVCESVYLSMCGCWVSFKVLRVFGCVCLRLSKCHVLRAIHANPERTHNIQNWGGPPPRIIAPASGRSLTCAPAASCQSQGTAGACDATADAAAAGAAIPHSGKTWSADCCSGADDAAAAAAWRCWPTRTTTSTRTWTQHLRRRRPPQLWPSPAATDYHKKFECSRCRDRLRPGSAALSSADCADAARSNGATAADDDDSDADDDDCGSCGSDRTTCGRDAA